MAACSPEGACRKENRQEAARDQQSLDSKGWNAMDTIFDERHNRHAGRVELDAGELVPCFEKPERAEFVLAAVRSARLGSIEPPDTYGLEPLKRVHSEPYLDFLRTAWPEWKALVGDMDALPMTWPVRRFSDRVPTSIVGRLGYYSFDGGAPITEGTWEAATAAADCTLTALAKIRAGSRGAFALVRPPGHHAASDLCGGYCYLNNAAIAAQHFVDGTSERVAILDVDYHHGNGTQSIFYDRSDVLYLSLHGDPNQEFPFYLGHADERGAGEGEGANRNFPMPWGTPVETWFEALEEACREIETFAPGVVIVSLGVDTYKGDPISQFLLESDNYLRLGKRLARLARPTLFVLEGGYAVGEIGVNVANVLGAYDAAG
jgi:acetoin utilization deacetylase AcuC-like enzyme